MIIFVLRNFVYMYNVGVEIITLMCILDRFTSVVFESGMDAIYGRKKDGRLFDFRIFTLIIPSFYNFTYFVPSLGF